MFLFAHRSPPVQNYTNAQVQFSSMF
jgi:hypothetical protein